MSIYVSPGSYESNRLGSDSSSPEYLLNVCLTPTPSTGEYYRWKILGVDKNWRDSYEGKMLSRDYYTVQYSQDLVNILGTYTHYLNGDITITINISA